MHFDLDLDFEYAFRKAYFIAPIAIHSLPDGRA